MDPEQAVRDFIAAVKELDSRPLTDYTQADVQEAWDIWANLAKWMQKNGSRPANLLEGRRWAARLEVLEKRIFRAPILR